MAEGKLFYIIGPSGCGKDSLIRYARERLAHNAQFIFAHRYITRAVELNGENHVALSEFEFTARLSAGMFAMHWKSHGLSYGIGREINMWLAKGCHVVMNGSREYLPEARRSYPEIIPVSIKVSSSELAVRLCKRGRETAEEIAARLARAEHAAYPQFGVESICNDGPLPEAGEQLVTLLSRAVGDSRRFA